MGRVEGTLAELFQGLRIYHGFQIVIFPDGDFVQFVGGAKAIKEIQERDAPFQCRQMGNRR